jgi:argininosuccinate lyase
MKPSHPKQDPATGGFGKAWAGRFSEATDPAVEQFTSSFAFDRRLYAYDIQGSVAHVQALRRAKLLTRTEATTLIRGLHDIQGEMDRGLWEVAPSDEDIHMHIERRLTEKVGPVGGKIHTGRSRNDQVALDLRLYLRAETHAILSHIRTVQERLVAQAETHLNVILPGYTHLQRAQPISLAHALLAYHEMLERDRLRFLDSLKRLDQMPLGSGALAGNSFALDRAAVARELGFSQVTANSLDAVSDRDFVIEFLSSASLLMMHLSRWAEDWILWASSEFGFVDLPDAYCTGSSMMPQKKNPDVLELIRGRTGRVYGALMTLLTVLKGLPLSYNRDLQEDKEPLFGTVDTLKSALFHMARIIQAARFNTQRMAAAVGDGFIVATDLADYLVTRGLPFRQAHHVVGLIVQQGLAEGKPLARWKLDEFRAFSDLFDADLFERLSPAGSCAQRGGIGGTATASIQQAIRKIKKQWKAEAKGK